MGRDPTARFESGLYRLSPAASLGVIETHQHVSEPDVEDRTFGWGDNHVDVILKTMDRCGVAAAILQPLGGANDPSRVHRMIREAGERHPGRIFGIASVNVKEYGVEKTIAEFERCVGRYGFVGIKFHGFSHGINPTSRQAEVYFDAARDLKVPLMVCVGAHGQPFTNPGLFADRLADYSDITMIFAHMDYCIAETAIALAARMPNLYLSTSLSIVPYLERAFTRVGANKIMLASEDAASIPAEIAKTVFASHDDAELSWVLRKTAIDVFALSGRLAAAT